MSKYFLIQELVPPGIYTQFGEKAWWFIQPVLIGVLDALREDVGRPLLVNNWHTGGSYQFSGYRPPETKIGAPYSMHRMGLAADVKCKGWKPADILKVIQDNQAKYLALGLTTYENLQATPTWLHLDCRRWPGDPITELKIVNP